LNGRPTTNAPCHPLEIRHAAAKDPVIHEKQRDLGPAKIECVEDLSDEQPLGHHNDVCRIKEVCMDAHSTSMHGEDEANNDEVPALPDVSYARLFRQSIIQDITSRTRSCSHPTKAAVL
jgi:hypothetical protein